MFHDVVGDGNACDESGFSGHAAAHYKLGYRVFEAHCSAIASVTPPDGVQLLDVPAGALATSFVSLTFDDGGRSACEYVADALEARGWRGHFFITTDYIGTAAFLTPSQIRSLRARGHRIGTHSCSHPDRIHRLSWDKLVREWSASARLLSDVLGEPVTTASVPGGYYARRVAQAAAEAGICLLFTSEPTTTPYFVEACLVVGRYVITRATSPGATARLAGGRLLPQLSEAAWWKAKRMAKALGGAHYDSLRRFLLPGMDR